MHKVNVSIPNKVAYRSQSTQFKLFRSISAGSYSQRKTSIFIRISEFFPADLRRQKFGCDSASRICFGWYSADKNSAANSHIRRRLGGLLSLFSRTTLVVHVMHAFGRFCASVRTITLRTKWSMIQIFGILVRLDHYLGRYRSDSKVKVMGGKNSQQENFRLCYTLPGAKHCLVG